MRPPHGRNGRRYRTVFISDVHLGCHHAHAAELLRFLNSCQPEKLYIVGDFIDGWKLRKSLKWKQIYNDVLARCHELARQGTRIYYTPGNHDAFMRTFAWNFDFMQVRDEFLFRALDGRRFLVTHGDLFDKVEQSARWVSAIASVGYGALLTANRLASRLMGTAERGTYSFSAGIKRTVKQFVRYISDFENALVRHARRIGCDGVICGHIHTPVMTQHDGIDYFNTGDWVENCTALVEYESGEFALLYYFEDLHFLESTPRPQNRESSRDQSCESDLESVHQERELVGASSYPSTGYEGMSTFDDDYVSDPDRFLTD
jgi:UDP-2,3-diacylglucosamine pyrophosphatase LpxH